MSIKRKQLFYLMLGYLAVLSSSHGQSLRQESETRYRIDHGADILREFAALLSLPNVASSDAIGSDNIQHNAEYIRQEFEKRGVKTEILDVPGGFPAIYGELKTPGAQKTIVFYAHYDGQPVDPSRWQTGPFTPTLFPKAGSSQSIDLKTLQSPLPDTSGEWRLFARSSGDDKAPIVAFLVALDSLKAAKRKPSINLKFFLEGEEERGSDHLGALLAKYNSKLGSDLWILCDGPVHQSGQFQLIYGARGVLGLEMQIFGPNRSLHSGHYGNWAPNPAVEIATLLSSMRDTEGKVLIKNFYSDVEPLTSKERDALTNVPVVDDRLVKELALGRTEGNPKTLNELILQPAMNVRGISAGAVDGSATNSIMTNAKASIDFRLVPRQTPDAVREQVEAHIRNLGYFITYDEPNASLRLKHSKLIQLTWSSGYAGFRSPLDSREINKVHQLLEKTTGERVLRVPALGGSIPMSVFYKALKTPIVILPIANYDNNQHAENENIQLKNLWAAVDIFETLFWELGR